MTTTAGPRPASTAIHSFKVVVAGSFAVGKSTLIRRISDIDVVGTEAPTSGAEADIKRTTTVGMEYGTLRVGDDDDSIELRLHGLPGQERFRFMWEIVTQGADGYLVLADVTRPDTIDEAVDLAERIRSRTDEPLVVGLNRAAVEPRGAGSAEARLAELGLPSIPCEVVDEASVRAALVELLLLVLDHLDRTELADGSVGPDDPRLEGATT